MVQSGELGELFILQGSYLQDWLLFPTDWNWRLEPNLGGTLRAVGDIGSHWLDLLTFITGLRVEEVYADFKTFHPIRKKPAKPAETYTGKILTPEDFVDQPISTEDYATVILHYQNGVRGVLTVSQVSSGRKNRLFYEINGSKSSLAWDSDSTRLASGSGDGTIKVWHLKGAPGTVTLRGHTYEVLSVAWSPDGTRLASASMDGTVKLWDVASGDEVLTLRGHTRAVLGVAFSPGGDLLASAGADGTVRIWDARPWTPPSRN